MTSISGRFSKFPAVDRSIPRSQRAGGTDLYLVSDSDILQNETPPEVSVETPAVESPVVVEQPQVETATAVVEKLEVPDVNAADLLKWAGSNRKRRAAALEAEQAGRKRKGVLKELDPNYVPAKNQVPLL